MGGERERRLKPGKKPRKSYFEYKEPFLAHRKEKEEEDKRKTGLEEEKKEVL